VHGCQNLDFETTLKTEAPKVQTIIQSVDNGIVLSDERSKDNQDRLDWAILKKY
jgi:hypothetical protein